MRYVNVWFLCSISGCDEKAELMVKVREENINGCSIDKQLPEGWSVWKAEYLTDNMLKDTGRTFCPAHSRDWPGI